jgi:hypothetical protein
VAGVIRDAQAGCGRIATVHRPSCPPVADPPRAVLVVQPEVSPDLDPGHGYDYRTI